MCYQGLDGAQAAFDGDRRTGCLLVRLVAGQGKRGLLAAASDTGKSFFRMSTPQRWFVAQEPQNHRCPMPPPHR